MRTTHAYPRINQSLRIYMCACIYVCTGVSDLCMFVFVCLAPRLWVCGFVLFFWRESLELVSSPFLSSSPPSLSLHTWYNVDNNYHAGSARMNKKR